MTIQYIQPGKPVQNSLIERFNGSYRREVLDRYAFRTLDEARAQTFKWMMYYNYDRPHGALQGLSPNEFVWNMENFGSTAKALKVYHISTQIIIVMINILFLIKCLLLNCPNYGKLTTGKMFFSHFNC